MTQSTFIHVDAVDTEELLLGLNTALSAEALAEFLLGEVSPFLNARARERFKSEGDDASGKWAPLKPETVRIREWGIQNQSWNIGPEHPINKRTGQLEEYITGGDGTTIPYGLGASLVFPDPARAVGDMRAKMMRAQKGGNKGRTPPRPVLALNETDMAFVLRRLLEHIVVGARGRLL